MRSSFTSVSKLPPRFRPERPFSFVSFTLTVVDRRQLLSRPSGTMPCSGHARPMALCIVANDARNKVHPSRNRAARTERLGRPAEALPKKRARANTMRDMI